MCNIRMARLYPVLSGCAISFLFPNDQRGWMKKLSLLLLFFVPGSLSPVFAELPTSSRNDEIQSDEHQRLNSQLTPDERRRLRGNLNQYSHKGYPDSEQFEDRRRMMQERFQTADGFGAITRTEAQLRLPKLAQHFDEIDTNSDGVITREEMAAAREKEKKSNSTSW